MDTLVLSKEEIFELTHYRRARNQMKSLASLGIPAYLRHDNTVCVLRADVTAPRALTRAAPQRKSVRAKGGEG